MRYIEMVEGNSLDYCEDVDKAVAVLKNQVSPDDVYLFLFLYLDAFDDVIEEIPELLGDDTLFNMKAFSKKIIRDSYDSIE